MQNTCIQCRTSILIPGNQLFLPQMIPEAFVNISEVVIAQLNATVTMEEGLTNAKNVCTIVYFGSCVCILPMEVDVQVSCTLVSVQAP